LLVVRLQAKSACCAGIAPIQLGGREREQLTLVIASDHGDTARHEQVSRLRGFERSAKCIAAIDD